MGGGILPVAFYKGKVYFLFSREQINSTKDAGLWSDFGGARDKDETFFETASREAYEESGGFLGSLKTIEKLIENKTLFTITKQKHRIYIVLIDYDRTLPKRFRNKFIKIKETKPHLIEKHNGLYEKDMLRWMSYNEVKNFPDFRKWYKKEFIPSILEKF
tara:strand:- start:51 stop:530 length:480 start_codon:yes stop_codon:yes gene_type:complete